MMSQIGVVSNPDREFFSSRCTKSQHGMCLGKTKRGDGICKCPCHTLTTLERLHLKNYRCKIHDNYFKRMEKL